MRRTASVVGCLAAFLAVPAVTSAQNTAPPGNAGIDEYVESVPSAAGNRPSSDADRDSAAGGAATGGRDGGVLTEAQRRALEAQGADGRALADQIEGQSASGGTSLPADRDDRAATPAPESQGDSPVRAVLEAASGGTASDGMGSLLPIVLGGTLALFVAAALMRRRASS